MGKLSKTLINDWMKNAERFEARGDGDNLWLRYRSRDLYPRWFLRYSIGGQPRTLHLGSYRDLSLAEARARAKKLRAEIALGHDVAHLKKDRVKAVSERVLAERDGLTVGALADNFYDRYIAGRLKHPEIVRSWINNRIKPAIGALSLADIRPSHVDKFIRGIAKDAPSTSTKILGCLTQIFNFGMKLGRMQSNPASMFDSSDAGGKARSRTRWLSVSEIRSLLTAMDKANGWTIQNGLSVRLLLMLAVRKSELIQACIDEFDLAESLWRIPAVRTKSERGISIPLPTQAVAAVKKLIELAEGSEWLLPARKMQSRMVPYISADTINAALAKCVRPLMASVDHFTLHDLRRTARTHLEALGIAPHVAERCLNHSIKGLVGVYNRYDYIDERREALQRWADFLSRVETEALDNPQATKW
ncbi:site-specific recombinase XerD [Luteibacter rhizovicinus]|uniref:Site-specific recombinase XerD n=1 Tax=Luteibacter rhizovicinus TaxID=242606 RepID=A0A4R3YIS7_9GAMM|nr:site-specific integrase [Luteibacter rhizovicinus]TCV92116.1 site-specific recombinase XerD [Luteibacter rhizovicinus]